MQKQGALQPRHANLLAGPYMSWGGTRWAGCKLACESLMLVQKDERPVLRLPRATAYVLPVCSARKGNHGRLVVSLHNEREYVVVCADLAAAVCMDTCVIVITSSHPSLQSLPD